MGAQARNMQIAIFTNGKCETDRAMDAEHVKEIEAFSKSPSCDNLNRVNALEVIYSKKLARTGILRFALQNSHLFAVS